MKPMTGEHTYETASDARAAADRWMHDNDEDKNDFALAPAHTTCRSCGGDGPAFANVPTWCIACGHWYFGGHDITAPDGNEWERVG